MQLSSKGRYAVMGMADLAASAVRVADAVTDNVSGAVDGAQVSTQPLPLATVSERQHISQTFLEQIFMQLRRSGLVKSTRGPGGGYVLARAAEDISILEIMQAVDEPVQMTRCSLDEVGGCVAGHRCLTHGLWQDLTQHIMQFLGATSLADVVKSPSSLASLAAFEGVSLNGDVLSGEASASDVAVEVTAEVGELS